MGTPVPPALPGPVHAFWRNLWARTAVEGALLLASFFVMWEVAEPMMPSSHLHTLHLARGVGAALLLGTWSFLRIRRARLQSDAETHAHLEDLEVRVRERTRELQRANAFTELLFDSLRERVVVFDAAGRVVKANRIAEETRDDPARVWEVETLPLPADDGHPGFLIEVGRDVTAQKNLEAQVRHQEKMASLGMLTAGFAHDLGNPLASLGTELELLEGEDDIERVRDSLDVLRRHVARMTRTLREMVDFARRRRDEISDVSIAAAVADSARLVRHDPRWKAVELVVDLPNDLPRVRMVEDHLVLVIVNIMLNAADAIDARGGTLFVDATRHGDEIELRFRDTGSGMSPEVLAKAKVPLFTTKSARHGTGLGLAVCDSIVRSIAGELRLSSTVGVGTEVSIRLPAPRGRPLAPPTRDAESSTSERAHA